MKILVVCQARTGSTRLPGKVLMPLAGAPCFVRQLERMAAATVPIEIVVATTEDAADDTVVEISRDAGFDVFRGHPTDLLDRHYKAAVERNADVVVKIPSDCPLIDPAVIDRVIGRFLEAPDDFDFVGNLHPATYPDGNDVEVMTMAALDAAFREAEKPHEREHTTPFLWDQPQRFRGANVAWETGLDYAMSHRFTIDYQADYEFISAVYDELWSAERPIFGLTEIISLLERRPEVYALNSRYAGVNWYRHHLDELETVSADETRQES